MLWLRNFFKQKIDKTVSDALYEDYRKTCRYTGEMPLTKAEYSKKFYERFRGIEEDE